MLSVATEAYAYCRQGTCRAHIQFPQRYMLRVCQRCRVSLIGLAPLPVFQVVAAALPEALLDVICDGEGMHQSRSGSYAREAHSPLAQLEAAQ